VQRFISRGSRLVARTIRAGLDPCHSYQVTWLQDYTDQSEITAMFVFRKVKKLAWKSVKYKRLSLDQQQNDSVASFEQYPSHIPPKTISTRANTKMHLACLTILLAVLVASTNASPTLLQSTLIMRPPFRSQYRHLFIRQNGCDQVQCDQCRNDANCTAGTPAW
jgi:hypothetical protein